MSEKVITSEFIYSSALGQIMELNSTERSDVGNIIQLPATVTGDASLSGKKIKMWGSDNATPSYRDKLLCDNNIIGELIDTKRNILLGNGLICYREIFKDGKKDRELVEIPSDIAKWIKDSHFYEDYLDCAPIQLYKHANVFAEFVTDNAGRVISVMSKDCKYMRAVQKVDGRIPGYIYSIQWKVKIDPQDKAFEKARYLPAYNREKKPKGTFMLHVADNVFNDGYYGVPAYWGGEEWIKVSNAIPVFHEANLRNGYTIRFKISYPERYFLNKYEFDQASALSGGDASSAKVQECLNNETQAKQEFINKMNNLLAGVANAGRALFVEESFNEMMAQYVGIKIEPIAFDMKDTALIDLYNATNQANISGQGIHPTLANIESQGKLSSGSEMRNAYLFYVLTKVPRPRKLVLRVWDIVFKLNGWSDAYPDLHWTFEDHQITKLDDDKSGTKPMEEGQEPPKSKANAKK